MLSRSPAFAVHARWDAIKRMSSAAPRYSACCTARQTQHTAVYRNRLSLPTLAELQDLYAIDADADVVRAAAVAKGHAESLPRWLAARPVASHTHAAFKLVSEWRRRCLPKDCKESGRPLVLDMGCGTGRSSMMLAQDFPECDVVGVDRNLALLKKCSGFRDGHATHAGGSHSERGIARRGRSPEAPKNLLAVRADIVDFYRLAYESGWRAAKTFIMYPNPFPKRRGFKSRLYGHPVFPLIISLAAGGTIEVRASWEAYLADFAAATRELVPAARIRGPCEIDLLSVAHTLTNFEEKYLQSQTPVYRLDIELPADVDIFTSSMDEARSTTAIPGV